MRWRFGLLASVFLIVGVASAGGQEATHLTVAAARSAIVKAKADLWKDDRSIRDASAGAPFACTDYKITQVGATPRADAVAATCVCVRANAKNAMGGYAGAETMEAVFSPIRPLRLRFMGQDGPKCGPLVPFPELNGK